MNRDQKKAIISRMPFLLKDIFLYVKQSDIESAERLTGNYMEQNGWDSKEVYGYLLVVAANEGEVEVAEFCKNRGADLNFEDSVGRTILWNARRLGNKQMVELLEGWGAYGSVNYGNKSSSNLTKVQSFCHAMFQGIEAGLNKEHLAKAVEDLVQNTRCEPKEIYGEFLCYTVARGNVEIAEFCRNQGADLNFRDHKGRTPFKIAKKCKREEMVKTLKEWKEHEKICKSRSEPSSNLESPSCSNQEKQKRDTKKMCNLM